MLGLQIRVGVQTGEVKPLAQDLGGVTVHIAARIAAAGDAEDAGDALVSSTVKDPVAGSELTFAERGEYVLKGVPDSWHLFSPER